jgi:hypothetical protein
MPIALEITAILALVAIVAVLVPLLYKLRRTAQGLDAFLVSTGKDLSQITEDVHASRLRMDHLAVSLQSSLDELSPLVRVLGQVGGLAKDYNIRFHSTIESASRNLGGILGGISAVMAFFKRKLSPREPQYEGIFTPIRSSNDHERKCSPGPAGKW